MDGRVSSTAAQATHPLQDNRFLLLEAVGRGGMGSVYRAFDRVEQRMVALKVLDQVERPGPSHPLCTEFEIWTRLRHPNVVRAYELCRARRGPLPRDIPYLILEYFGGRPANQAIPPGRSDSATLEEFTRRVLHALQHVHAAGLVHRDLKPGNVLVGPAHRGPGRVKLTDFGLAERAGREGQPGCLSGSLPYAAPESMLGRRLDGRADLYGLGILLYLLATGRMPLPSREPDQIIRWHLGGSRPDPRKSRPDLSERMSCFIRRLTSRDPDERPASAEEALFLLGVRLPPLPAAPRPVAGRAELAALRLAIDAARLGGRRLVLLPRSSAEAAPLVHEARVLAGIHGLGFHCLRPGPRSGSSNLGRLVLRLLLDHGEQVKTLIDRYALQRGLPLGLLGGLPVWDRMREGLLDGTWDSAARRATARGVAAFLLESSRRRSLVLHVERRATDDPLVREVVRFLARTIEERPGPSPSRGGLLVLIEDPFRTGSRESRTRPGTSRSCCPGSAAGRRGTTAAAGFATSA